MLGHGSPQMTILPRSLTFTRITLLLVCITALAMVSWACSSGPEIVDPTSTAAPLPTNTLVPQSTSAPTDAPPTHPSPDSTPDAPPTTRDWNVLGSPDATVSIADFGDFHVTRLPALGPWCGPRSKESLRRNWAGEPEILPFPSYQR